MLVFAGIAFLKASSPVLGSLVSGEKRTAFAGETDHDAQPGKGNEDVSCTKITNMEIAAPNFFI